MFRKLLTASALLSTVVVLGGCGDNGIQNIAQASAAIDDVRAKATTACGYLPAAETVAALLKRFVPQAGAYLDPASSIAAEICSVVPKGGALGVRRGGTVAVLHGVPIRGRFVR